MKKITITGVGMNAQTLTKEALSAIESADILMGARRMTDMFSHLGKKTFHAYSPKDVKAVIGKEDVLRFAVLVSGDTGFYSAAEGLVNTLDGYDVTVLPGISSLNYFFSKLKRPWQDAKLISCHGRECNLVDTVRRNRFTFALTGGNMSELCNQLLQAGFGHLSATVGENLGTEQEKIRCFSISQWLETETSALAVMLIENPCFDHSTPTGIPDDRFVRSAIPMTKAEIRAVIMSKLCIQPNDICYDIGCGTGSVTVEIALSAYGGHVYAVDRSPEAVELTKANCEKFHIGNVSAFMGTAPDIMEALPAPDAAFIGGSGGNMDKIISRITAKNPHVRIAVSAIAMESAMAAVSAFGKQGISAEITQLWVSRSKQAGDLHMMTALNPIFIISGAGNG